MLIFCMGYLAIIFEHKIGVNKATSALIMAVFLWTIQFSDPIFTKVASFELNEHLANICQVLLFLLAALTIVEIIHVHGGLTVVSRLMQVRSKRVALWVVGLMAFFLSSVLDNLTTTIVMVMMLKKIVRDYEDRLLFGSTVVIAANAGGAWTPIGDVTTTMLWVGGQISSTSTMLHLVVPSFACLVGSLLCLMPQVGGTLETDGAGILSDRQPRGRTVLACGVFSLIFVPIFKGITGLPPYMAILFSMSGMWLLTDLIHRPYRDREHLKVVSILPRVDLSGILFFLGILLAVDALEVAGILRLLAHKLDHMIPSKELIAVVIGGVSAIIDNVPLVAACMGMYNSTIYPMDSSFWQLIAYCAGTGGSMLVIGSAAGVAFMGIEKVEFFWYVRRVGLAAFVGYVSGIVVYLLQEMLIDKIALL